MSRVPITGTPENAYALIVGIGAYQDRRIPRLDFTHADARGFYELLVDPRRAGFEPDNVTLLLDADATSTRIRKAVNQWLFSRINRDSTVLIFFACHGGQEQDKNDPDSGKPAYYFLPWDADPEDLASTCLSQYDFIRLLGTLKSQRLVVFLDACHSSGVAKPGARDLAIVSSPDYKRIAEGEGRVIIAASRPEQRSWEDEKLRHGIFTYHLLEALRGKADANGDGYVSIQEVASYLQREVPRTVRMLGKEPQDPTFICESLTKDIILTVDSEKLKQRAIEQSEAEQKRIAEMRDRRRKLVELRERNELPLTEFTEAMLINEKQSTDLSQTEATLKQYLDLLLTDRMAPKLYLQTRDRIHADNRNEMSPRNPQAPAPPRPVFCIHCGSRNGQDNAFCIQCGRRRS